MITMLRITCKNAETQRVAQEMIEWALTNLDNDIIPAWFQPRNGGRSANVTAAIRLLKKLNYIENHDVDGLGKPIYRATGKAFNELHGYSSNES